MKRIALLLVGMCAVVVHAQEKYDVVIVGGTPGGIMAAVSAARLGKTAVILERTAHIGGLPANGLGATDITTRNATTGLFLEFVQRVKKHYTVQYGAGSPQARDCSDGYHFEPSVAEKVLHEMIREQKKITVKTMRQFDALAGNVVMQNSVIAAVKVSDRLSGKTEVYTGRVFIDGTYEGDLAAAAGVPYRIGREGKNETNEPGAGVTYKYWEGAEIMPFTTGMSDNAIQAYNYRLNLTNIAANRLAFNKPPVYSREEFLSLAGDVKKAVHQGAPGKLPGMRTGIDVVVNNVVLPNGKVDANNQHMGLLSTDLPEENWAWPAADWNWRDRYAARLKSYTLGLLYFASHDASLPDSFRNACLQWGFSADEYPDNDHFPRQVYVREGRRIEGVYLFTAHDALPLPSKERPRIHVSSITASHYTLDSHAAHKREDGKPALEGFLSYDTKPYTVPYEVMLPKTVSNLLCPVPVSATHIGFSTLRMEPCWMALGQAAGVAAFYMMDKKTTSQQVPISMLQATLLEQGATLIYFKDLRVSDPDYKKVQALALQGYFPGFEAAMDKAADAATIQEWSALRGIPLQAEAGKTTKRQLLSQL